MFGDVLVIIRGGNKLRRICRTFMGTQREIFTEIDRLTKRRLQRGYTLINN